MSAQKNLSTGQLNFLKKLCAVNASAWAPPPDLSLSEWADEYRFLSSESTSEHGKWDTDRVPYLREPMNAITDDETEEITFMKSAQVGYTEGLVNNVVGYFIHQDPCPVLVTMPTLNIGMAYSKDRLAPMVRDTPVLEGCLTGSSSLHKSFPGGHITISGANSPASLASRPIRIFIADEVDRFPESAGEEGDPLALGDKRTTTFHDRKKIRGGTPTIKGFSRTEELFESGTMERFHIPCANCEQFQVLKWANVAWEKDENKKGDEKHLVETAHYLCEHCGYMLDDADIVSVLAYGKWVAEHPERGKFHRSFHINELYSPWVKLSETVANFIRAKKDKQLLKVWINTALGETFEDEGEKVDYGLLYNRREHYPAPVPEGVLSLVAGVDVQDDRLEVEVVGYDKYHESWSIDYRVYTGNPAEDELWKRLDSLLMETFQHESGAKLMIDAMGIDTGGHHTSQVYSYCGARWARRVYALKGVSGFGKATVGRFSRQNKGKVRLFPVGVDSIKQLFYGYLRINEPGPGYCHFPVSPEYDQEHFRRLTAEKLVTEMRFGKVSRKWVLMMPRNEPLDCRIYAEAALEILKPAWESFEERISQGGVFLPQQADTQPAALPKKRKRRVLSRGL